MEKMALDNRPTGSDQPLDSIRWNESVGGTATGISWSRQAKAIVFLVEEPVVALTSSGSNIRNATLWSEFAPVSAISILAFHEPKGDSVDLATTHTAKEKITYIRACLGMPITELARATQATRQTIYDWLNNQTPRPDKLRRIDQLYRLAQVWNQICPWPIGKFFQYPLNGGKSVSDLFAVKTIDNQQIQSAMRELREFVTSAQESHKRQSIAERLQAQGFKPKSEEGYRADLNIIAPPTELSDPDEG